MNNPYNNRLCIKEVVYSLPQVKMVVTSISVLFNYSITLCIKEVIPTKFLKYAMALSKVDLTPPQLFIIKLFPQHHHPSSARGGADLASDSAWWLSCARNHCDRGS